MTQDFIQITQEPTLMTGDLSQMTLEPTLMTQGFTQITQKPTLMIQDLAKMANEPTLMTQDLSQMTWEAIAAACENVICLLNKNGSEWTDLGMQYLVGTVSANEIDPWKKFMLLTHCMPGTCKKESLLLHKWRQHDSFETQTIKMIYRKTQKNERNASEASFPQVTSKNTLVSGRLNSFNISSYHWCRLPARSVTLDQFLTNIKKAKAKVEY